MTVRLILMASVTAMLVAGAAPPVALAHSDPMARSLIDRLKPSTTSGLHGSATFSAATVAPAPGWRAPAPPASEQAAPGRPAAVAPRTVAAVRETTTNAPSVSIAVTFGADSTTLTPEAEKALAPLGRALASPELEPYRFRIENHTDSVGDAAVNQALSERRATAVRQHLAQVHGIDPVRLVAAGLGSSQMLVRTPPQVAEARNRRVQVVNIGN